MYTQLTQLALLQGMNATDLAQVQKLAQMYHTRSSTPMFVSRQGEMCNMLSLLLTGTLLRTFTSPNGDFEFEEQLSAPWIIEPESLYGLNCTYSCGYTLMDNSTMMTLTKQDMATLFARNEIFRMNYLNVLSATQQRLRAGKMQPFTSEIDKRIISFFSTLSLSPNGTKILRIKMEDLARYMNETRLSVSRVLNKWQESGLAELQRKEIHVPRLENLVSFTQYS